ncbi:MAG: hypothetical protein LN415_01840 [Candidatus Thermoplasmatota archaeon]|nr:hypothetical protein [Candidatus Thermoplasmatota archaeon]
MSIRTILCALQTYPYPGPWVPQKRDDKTALTIIVVVVAVFIIASVVMSAVLYVMVSGLIGYDGSYEPVVILDVPELSAGNQWSVAVAGVSSFELLDDFEAILLENGTWLDRIAPLDEGTPPPLSFTDVDGGYSLSVGDFFTITCKPGSHYELVILWRASSSKVGGEDWYT